MLQLSSLQKKLELKAGFRVGDCVFSLRLKEKDDKSSWNFEKRIITIGSLNAPEEWYEEYCTITMEHEAGHVIHTSKLANTEYPFAILNILEDARIENKQGEFADFGALHACNYQKHYVQCKDRAVFSNPFNIGVLIRWRRWGVDTEIDEIKGITSNQHDEFLKDWDDAISRSIGSANTFLVGRVASQLYEKWKELFDQYPPDYSAQGQTEESADDMLGSASEKEDELETSSHNSSDEITQNPDCFGEAWFDWRRNYIEEQINMLKSVLRIEGRSYYDYGMSGRRFDIRRIENPPLPPFRVEHLARNNICMHKMLIVIDGSGSMRGEPFRNASHVAAILSAVFPADIMITTTDSQKPIAVTNIDSLRMFCGWGGGENYVSISDIPLSYHFTLFLTDAQISDRDEDYVQNRLRKMTILGAGYVGEESQNLEEIFHRIFLSTGLHNSIGRQVGLFINRNFIRITTN